MCFDIGGVLVRMRRAWADCCRAAGLELRGPSACEVVESALRELCGAHVIGDMTMDQWVAAMQNALGGLYTPAEITAFHDAVIYEEYPGIGLLIDDLHRAGVATACLSNTNDAHWVKLVHHDGVRSLPGDPRYPSVCRLGGHYASHLMRAAKPAPGIFRAFEKATGRTGAEIVFFDDLPENIEAARALGWNAELIDPQAPTDVQMRRHLARRGVL